MKLGAESNLRGFINILKLFQICACFLGYSWLQYICMQTFCVTTLLKSSVRIYFQILICMYTVIYSYTQSKQHSSMYYKYDVHNNCGFKFYHMFYFEYIMWFFFMLCPSGFLRECVLCPLYVHQFPSNVIAENFDELWPNLPNWW